MAGFSVFVTVGTDHHPFNRLVGWSDWWSEQHPGCRVVVQHGTSHPPRRALGLATLSHTGMLEHMRAADVVVTQGGPAGIMDSRACGKLPIVVPRDPRLGEHIDDHQIRFAQHMGQRGRVIVASDRAEFDRLVTRAGSAEAEFLVADAESPTARTAALIDETLTGLVTLIPGQRRWSWPRAVGTVSRTGADQAAPR